jgi:hypothetical protein
VFKCNLQYLVSSIRIWFVLGHQPCNLGFCNSPMPTRLQFYWPVDDADISSPSNFTAPRHPPCVVERSLAIAVSSDMQTFPLVPTHESWSIRRRAIATSPATRYRIRFTPFKTDSHPFQWHDFKAAVRASWTARLQGGLSGASQKVLVEALPWGKTEGS